MVLFEPTVNVPISEPVTYRTRAVVPLALMLNAAVVVTITGVAEPPPVVPSGFIGCTAAQPTSSLAGGGVVQSPPASAPFAAPAPPAPPPPAAPVPPPVPAPAPLSALGPPPPDDQHPAMAVATTTERQTKRNLDRAAENGRPDVSRERKQKRACIRRF